MSFEEDFPSLCEKVPLKHRKYEMKAWTENAIAETCLDKQKVKSALEVINSLVGLIPPEMLCKFGLDEKIHLREIFLKTITFTEKELGLNE